jgi:hypothetical protein
LKKKHAKLSYDICKNNTVQLGIVLAIVTKDYLAQDPEELSLQKNRIVTVLDQHIAEGWWKGDLNGKIGVFPADVCVLFLCT